MSQRENTIRAGVILLLIIAAGLAITILTLDGDREALALSARFEGSLGILVLAFLDSLRVAIGSSADARAHERLERYSIRIGDPVICDQEGGRTLRGECVGHTLAPADSQGFRAIRVVVEHDDENVRVYPLEEVRRAPEREATGGHRIGIGEGES